jgi:prenyl protein peptidase
MKGISPALLEPLGQLEPLTNAQARTLSLVFTASYVGSIYVSTFFAGFSAASTRTQRRTGGTSIGQRNDKGVEGLEGQPGPEGPGDGVGIPPISASDTDAQALLKPPIRDDEMEEEMDDAPKAGDRDHPDTIKRRIAGVTAATGLSLGAVWYVVAVQGGTGFAQAVRPFYSVHLEQLPLERAPSPFRVPLRRLSHDIEG